MTTKKKLRTPSKPHKMKMKFNPNSKGLDAPRQVRGEYVMSTCVSVGMPSGGGGDSKGMHFQQRPPNELYGKQTKELSKQEKIDQKDKE